MKRKRVILCFGAITIIVVIVGCSYSLGFYKGCVQAIGENENMGAALSMNCPNASAAIGEIIFQKMRLIF